MSRPSYKEAMRIVLWALAAAALAIVIVVLLATAPPTEGFGPQEVADLAKRVSQLRPGKADEEDDEDDDGRNEVQRDPDEVDEIDEKYGAIALGLMTGKREAFDKLVAHYESAEAHDLDKLEADLMPSCGAGAPMFRA